MVTVAIYLSVTLAFIVSFFALPRLLQTERQAVRRRFARAFDRPVPGTNSGVLYKDPGELSRSVDREQVARADATAGRERQKKPKPTLSQRLDQLLHEASVPIPSKAMIGIMLAAAVLAAALGLLIFRWPLALASGMAGGTLPLIALLARRKVIRDRILVQLPNAFTLMARVLRSGQSVDQAMLAVGDTFREPLSREFAQCHQQQELGLRQEAILRDMADRSGILELRIFAMAVIIQRQVGGNLSEVLNRLADMVRDRLTTQQQIRTLTAEGRLQGWTLVVLPIVVFAITFFMNRQYAQLLLDHKGLLLATAGSMTAGIVWIRRIVRFDD